jgi:hypothetical protein
VTAPDQVTPERVVVDEREPAVVETSIFRSDTVLIAAATAGFALAMLGWLAGHAISLALPPEVAARAMVPLLVGTAGLFTGAGLGLLLGELKRVVRRPAGRGRADDPDLPRLLVDGLRTLPAARVLLAVGVILLVVAAWMVKPG